MIPEAFWIDDLPDRTSQWLLPGLLCRYVNILSGQPKVGKSTLAANMALALIEGRGLIGEPGPTAPGKVAWIGFDAGWDAELKSRIGDRSQNSILIQPPFDLTNQALCDELGKRLQALNCSLLVVDNLYGFANNHKLDINSQLDASVALAGLLLVSRDYEIPVLLLAHASKARDGEVAHSNYFQAQARVLLQLTGKGASGKRTLKVIANEAETSTYTLYLSDGRDVKYDEATAKTRVRDRDYAANLQKGKLLWDNSTEADRVSGSALGRRAVQLRLSASAEAGRKLVDRMVERGIYNRSGYTIVRGPNFFE